jgi:hypothetical protein
MRACSKRSQAADELRPESNTSRISVGGNAAKDRQNAADIDGARAVWACDLGAVENEKLLHYYPDRTAWLVEPGALPPRLMPYRPDTSGPDVIRLESVPQRLLHPRLRALMPLWEAPLFRCYSGSTRAPDMS